MQLVMRHQNVKGAITGSDHAMEIDDQFDVMIDANDQILERVVNTENFLWDVGVRIGFVVRLTR
jgi:hypothetical protein